MVHESDNSKGLGQSNSPKKESGNSKSVSPGNPPKKNSKDREVGFLNKEKLKKCKIALPKDKNQTALEKNTAKNLVEDMTNIQEKDNKIYPNNELLLNKLTMACFGESTTSVPEDIDCFDQETNLNPLNLKTVDQSFTSPLNFDKLDNNYNLSPLANYKIKEDFDKLGNTDISPVDFNKDKKTGLDFEPLSFITNTSDKFHHNKSDSPPKVILTKCLQNMNNKNRPS